MSGGPGPAVCVFCGSRVPRSSAIHAATDDLADALSDRGATLVYGGASIGLMGRLADASLRRGVEVHGVIPASLFRQEVAHTGVSHLHEVDGMHARKALMADLADVFVALPGGLGTLEELFEVWTWAHLGLHDKPVGLLDVAGYWHGLVELIDRAVAEDLVTPERRAGLIVDDEPHRLLDRLLAVRSAGAVPHETLPHGTSST